LATRERAVFVFLANLFESAPAKPRHSNAWVFLRSSANRIHQNRSSSEISLTSAPRLCHCERWFFWHIRNRQSRPIMSQSHGVAGVLRGWRAARPSRILTKAAALTIVAVCTHADWAWSATPDDALLQEQLAAGEFGPALELARQIPASAARDAR